MKRVDLYILIMGIIGGFTFGKTIYIKEGASGNGTTWTSAYGLLQDGLDGADPNDKIWVAAGTYKPTSDYGLGIGERGKHFRMKNRVGIYGGFPATGNPDWNDRDPNTYNTILSGDIGILEDPDDNCYHVFYHPQETNLDPNAVLDGFFVIAGNANSAAYPDNCGGGMFTHSGSPTIVDCVFEKNAADFIGGAVMNFSYSCPTFSDCLFENNVSGGDAGGVENYGECHAAFTHCEFRGNRANSGGGGGMSNYESDVLLDTCNFTQNTATKGGGMSNWGSSNPELFTCVFSKNKAEYGGGMSNAESNPMLVDCAFVDNQTWPYSDNLKCKGAGMLNDRSSPILYNCIFKGNISTSLGYPKIMLREGGGIYNTDSDVVLEHCDFIENYANYWGGGISSRTNSNVTAVRCRFIGNETDSEPIQPCRGGAVAVSSGFLYLYNCHFSGNLADRGGAVYLADTSSSTITNCTLSENRARMEGRAMYIYNSNPALSNTIIWNQTPDRLICNSSSTPMIHTCNISGCGGSGYGWDPNTGIDGGGNIDTNPLFIDADGPDFIPGTEDDDLHLFSDSPCIDAGDNNSVPGDMMIDLDGLDRFVDGNCDSSAIVDMGAYEFDWLYVGDFAGGCNITLDDFSVLSENWKMDNPAIDIAPFLAADGIIDIKELLVFTEHWLEKK